MHIQHPKERDGFDCLYLSVLGALLLLTADLTFVNPNARKTDVFNKAMSMFVKTMIPLGDLVGWSSHGFG